MIELLELSQVLNAVRTTGTEVRYHHERCDKVKTAGFYKLTADVDLLVICTRNNLNLSDLFDTVRHEAIHVVQACNHGPVLDRDYYSKNSSQEHKTFVQDNYPAEYHHHELEAFTAAKNLSEDDVVKLINKFCF